MAQLYHINVAGLTFLVCGIIGNINLFPVIPLRIPFIQKSDTLVNCDLLQKVRYL